MKTNVRKNEMDEIIGNLKKALKYSIKKHPDFPNTVSSQLASQLNATLVPLQEYNDNTEGTMLSVLREEAYEFALEYSLGNYEKAEEEGYHIMSVAARMVIAARILKNKKSQENKKKSGGRKNG